MPVITLEEHFLTKQFLVTTGALERSAPPQMVASRAPLLDLGTGRIADMDLAGIDVQVLSLSSMGIELLDAETAMSLAHDVNDELAAAIKQHPDRLRGWACLVLKSPASAAKELERCVQEHGFCGALIDGTTDDLFLDHPRFLPFFEAASHLRVPIYVHPGFAPRAVQDIYFGHLPPEVSFPLSIAGWGWHAELGLHTLRLIVSGLLDRFPELQIIIGHMGEGVPYALARSSMVFSQATHLRQSVAEYFQTNIHVTTSGYFTQPPFNCAKEVLGMDRMMFSVDYPFSPNMAGRRYLDALQPILSEDEFAKLTHRNAERLLRL